MGNLLCPAILNTGVCMVSHPSPLAGKHPEDVRLLKDSLTWKNYRKCSFKRADTSVIFWYPLERVLVFRDPLGSCRQLCRYSLS